MEKKEFLIGLIAVFFFLASCDQGQKNKSGQKGPDITRKQVTTQWASEFDWLLDQLEKNIIQLDTHFKRFESSRDEEQLEAVQHAWGKVAASLQQANFFNVGKIKMRYGILSVDYWPVNNLKIDEVLKSDLPVDSAFMASAGNSIKGIWALESLLFDPQLETAGEVALFKNKTGKQRLDFARAQIEFLKSRCMALENLWGDFRGGFAANSGTGVNEPFAMMINQMNSQLEAIKNEHLAKPMGLELGGEAAPQLAQGFQSESGFEVIRARMIMFQKLVDDGNSNSPDLTGLLRSSKMENSRELSENIPVHISKALTAIDAIKIPLSKAVIEQPSEVQTIYENIQQLVVLLKADVASHLSITITFNDMDGD